MNTVCPRCVALPLRMTLAFAGGSPPLPGQAHSNLGTQRLKHKRISSNEPLHVPSAFAAEDHGQENHQH